MRTSVYEKIKRSIQAAEWQYYRLVLLVGEDTLSKNAALKEAAKEFSSPIINVNLKLSQKLMELTPRQRCLLLPGILNALAEQALSPTGQAAPLVLLDNIDILFDINLGNDPLRLLQTLSRNRTVLAWWNGTIRSGRLIYAENGHQEYRSYHKPDALIVDMGDMEAIGTAANH